MAPAGSTAGKGLFYIYPVFYTYVVYIILVFYTINVWS
jgi:hypothetical protein